MKFTYNGIRWEVNSLTHSVIDQLGFIPSFLHSSDPRPLREQLNTAYAHGGGWMPFEGFVFDEQTRTITYPGDPALAPIAWATLNNENIIVYPHAWVLIRNASGIEIARMD